MNCRSKVVAGYVLLLFPSSSSSPFSPPPAVAAGTPPVSRCHSVYLGILLGPGYLSLSNSSHKCITEYSTILMLFLMIILSLSHGSTAGFHRWITTTVNFA